MAKRGRTSDRSGWIVIDKPVGWTSHDVVAKVRRIVGERRVGHAGTLDPGATGVLPIAVGLATRTVEYLASADKAYGACIHFGATTDTDDVDGEILGTADVSHLSLELIAASLDGFAGEIQQRPPAHSAIHVDGTRAYKLARRGDTIELPARTVVIHEIEIISWDAPVLCLDITCSKGTYIRAIARDLGRTLGTGAYLERLVRTRSGPFALKDARSLDDLQRDLEIHDWTDVALRSDVALDQLTPIVLQQELELAWQQGKQLSIQLPTDVTSEVRAYNAAGAWLGIGAADAGSDSVRPVKVIQTG